MSTVAPALRLVAALRAGACLVARPKSRVTHLYLGPLTPSGCRVPRGRRVVCGLRTRTLTVVAHAATDPAHLPGRPRRWCRRCNALTPPTIEQLDGPRERWLSAFGHLTVVDVHTAALWSGTVAETHQVGTVALMVCGGKPWVIESKRAGLPADKRALLDLHEAIEKRRRDLITHERTDEERRAASASREAEAHNLARITKARRQDAATAKAVELDADGHYLAPWERAALHPDTSHRAPRSTRP